MSWTDSLTLWWRGGRSWCETATGGSDSAHRQGAGHPHRARDVANHTVGVRRLNSGCTSCTVESSRGPVDVSIAMESSSGGVFTVVVRRPVRTTRVFRRTTVRQIQHIDKIIDVPVGSRRRVLAIPKMAETVKAAQSQTSAKRWMCLW